MGNRTSRHGQSLVLLLNNARRKSSVSNQYIRAPLIATQKIYVALGNYQAQSLEEISFKKGDEMELISALRDSLFMLVRLMDGTEHGYVPVRLVAEKDSLRTQEWFHGNISRTEAEKVIMAPENGFGSFIIRNSGHLPDGYALTVKNFDFTKDYHVKNYRIKRNVVGHYYINCRDTFPTLQELVRFYQNHVTQIHLVHPCRKPEVNRRHSCDAFTYRNEVNLPRDVNRRQSCLVSYESVQRRHGGDENVQLRFLKTESVSEREFLEGAINIFRSNKIVYFYAVCGNDDNARI